jgi:hypothetical protein
MIPIIYLLCHIAGTAAVQEDLSLDDLFTTIDPTYSGCPTHDFKRCYEVKVSRALASLQTIALPGIDESGEGLTVYRVSTAMLTNNTVRVSTKCGLIICLIICIILL